MEWTIKQPLVLGIILILVTQSGYLDSESTSIQPQIAFPVMSQDYIDLDEIHVHGDDELFAMGFGGMGTAGSPIIIEGFNVSSINFGEIGLHVIIRNCLIGGIYFAKSNNTIFENCVIENYFRSWDCNNIQFLSNNIESGFIHIGRAVDFTLFNNTIGLEIQIMGESLQNWRHDFSLNTVGGKPFGYVVDEMDLLFNPDDYGQLVLVNCTNCEIVDGTSVRGRYVSLGHCANCTFSRNTNWFFSASYSHNITASYNSGNTSICRGIYLDICTDSIVYKNSFYDNEKDGIGLALSVNCTIANNTVTGYTGLRLSGQTIGHGAYEQSGISLYQSSSCLIVNNTLYGNPRDGVWLFHSGNNLVLSNDIRENSIAGIEGRSKNSSFIGNIVCDNEGPGFILARSDNGIISQNVVCNNSGGIFIEYDSVNVTIIYNTVTDSSYGIRIDGGTNFTIHGNNMTGTGLIIRPGWQSDWNFWRHNVTENYVNGRPLGYWWGLDSQELNITDYSQVFICYSTNVSVSNLTIPSTSLGLVMVHTSNSTVNRLTLNESSSGIELSYCSSCIISNSMFFNNSDSAVYLYRSYNCTIESSNFEENHQAIRIYYGSELTISENTFASKLNGISMTGCRNCTITNNSFIGCSLYVSGIGGDSNHHVEDNLVNGLPLGYFSELSNTKLDIEDFSAVILVECDNVVAYGGTFSNASYGVIAIYCADIVVESVTCTMQKQSGVYIEASYNCTLLNCTMTDNSEAGIEMGNTWSSNIGNNIIRCDIRHNDRGMDLTYDRSTTILDTTIEMNYGYGVFLYYGDYFTMRNCSITDNGLDGVRGSYQFTAIEISQNIISRNGGIGLCGVHGNVTGNTISDNGSHGLLFEGGVIDNNEVHSNNGTGILSYYVRNAIILRNSITNNSEYGISLHQNYLNHIFNNTLFNNSLAANKLGNALDHGMYNRWDNGEIGNAWDDWSGEGVYNIPGFAGSIDRYPRHFETVVTTIATSTSTFTTTSTSSTTSTYISTTPTTSISPDGSFVLVIVLVGVAGVCIVGISLLVLQKYTTESVKQGFT